VAIYRFTVSCIDNSILYKNWHSWIYCMDCWIV